MAAKSGCYLRVLLCEVVRPPTPRFEATLGVLRNSTFGTPCADPLLVAAWAEVAVSGPAGHVAVSIIGEEELDADEDCCPGAGRPRGLGD